MAFPTTAIVRPELGANMEEFTLQADRRGFVGLQILPPRIVSADRGEFAVVPLEQLLKSRATDRAPMAGYNRDSFKWEMRAFRTSEHGVEEVLDDAQTAAFRDVLDQEAVASQRAIDAVARALEVEIASTLFDPTVWTGSSLTTSLEIGWNDEGATPIEDIEAARQKIILGCGLVPNTLVVTRMQFHALKNSDQVVDRVKYSGHTDPARITPAAVASVLDLDRIVIANAQTNVAAEGQEASLIPAWSDQYSMLCRTATGDDPAEPSLGRVFMWAGDSFGGQAGGGEAGVILESYREEARRGDIIRARANWGIVILYTEAAHLLSSVLSGVD